MRTLTIIAIAALASACTLDLSTKPVGVAPMGTPDVFYVPDPPSGTYKVVGDVIANDVSPDGRELSIYLTLGGSKTSDTTVEVEISAALPLMVQYKVTNGILKEDAWIPVWVVALADQTIHVESGTSAPVSGAFQGLRDTSPAALELITPPSHGMLAGTVPGITYVSDVGYCGTDSATFRVHAANGDSDFVVTFDVGIVLADEQQRVEFGSSTSIDVLANERDGLELIATNTGYATINTNKDAVIVDPPVNKAATYEIEYTARDNRGCEGKATLRLDVEFPTRVVVGTGLTGDAFDASLSDDGRYIAFTSADSTLVTGDTNGAADVFVLDIETNVVERVSVATGGAQANDSSTSPTISADGRYVAFVSRATNFTSQDTTSVEDVYVHDRTGGTTTLVSVSVDNTGSDRPSLTPHISANGTRVVFASEATRVVSNDTNDVMDVFVRDIPGMTTQRVSVTSAGAQVPFASSTRPRISGNGRYVALSSTSSLDGSNSSGAFLVDTTGSAVSRIHAHMGEVDLDATGRLVIHANGYVTLLDRVIENTTVLDGGVFPSLSADGRYSIYAYSGAGAVGACDGNTCVYVNVDRVGGIVLSTPLRRPEVSGDGRWIVFATNEWPGYLGRFVIVRVWNRAYSG